MELFWGDGRAEPVTALRTFVPSRALESGASDRDKDQDTLKGISPPPNH